MGWNQKVVTPAEAGDLGRELKLERPQLGPFLLWGSLSWLVVLADAVAGHWILRQFQSGVTFDSTELQTIGNLAPIFSVALWALSAWAFLSSVHKSKIFLTRNGADLTGFNVTVLMFAVPFANLFVPWKHLAEIKKSVRHSLETGRFEVSQVGDSGIISVAVLYFLNTLLLRFVWAMPVNSISDYQSLVAICYVSAILYLLSFIRASTWLSELVNDTTRAMRQTSERVDPLPMVSEQDEPLDAPTVRPPSPLATPETISASAPGPSIAEAPEAPQANLHGRLHEGLRRLTLVAAALWMGITLIPVISKLGETAGRYEPSPIGTATMIFGGSAIAFSILYFGVRAVAWVIKGFAAQKGERRRQVNDRLAMVSAVSGLAILAAGAVIYEVDRSALERAQASEATAVTYPLEAPADTTDAAGGYHFVADPVITQAEFEGATLGMTYEEVVAVVGAEGRQTSAETIGNWKYVYYRWENEPAGGGGWATMTFLNGQLQEKRPSGLP